MTLSTFAHALSHVRDRRAHPGVGRGVLFAARANRLYKLYLHLASLDQFDPVTRNTIERT
ncbi:hypothetical protein [Massilia sp. S19_KUP03_FR1]|uniref:hypothetical protein n=1 Tax=Massilia sp. S19_KUP03_FR1 TaxID=3025503 RepID=UPI002FCD6EC8